MARLRKDGNAHVALEYEQHKGTSRFLIFSPSGLQREELGTEQFERRFSTALDKPLGAAALRLLELNSSAYLPDDRANTILLEIYTMSKTDGTNDLTTLDTKALVAMYNELAKVAGKPELKAFKEGKAKLVARVESLKAEVAKLTPEQEEHKKERAEAADKRLASVKERKNKTAAEKLEAAADRVAESKKPAKREPKPKGKPATAAKADGEKKPRGLGIGAFCMDLIKAGKGNEDVLAAVAKKFPDAKTSAASVAWYRNKLKSEGEIA